MDKDNTPSASYLSQLPVTVLDHIYGYDTTVRDFFSQSVLRDLYRRTHAVHDHLDQGYTIRNWHEAWAIVPRYILPENGRLYGSYIRGGMRIRTPL